MATGARARLGATTRTSSGDETGHLDGVVDQVEDAVDERPWVKQATRLGWVAKGAVYILFGLTAWSIARHESTDDAASPQGALDSVMDQPGGRLLLGVLAVGLALYVCWRVLSVVMRRGNDARAWADRIGYAFSAVFYASLAFVAARGAWRGAQPEDSSTVEDLSAQALENTAGRWLLGAAGVITIGVGLYFIVKKGIKRGFHDDVRLGNAGEGERKAVEVSGVAGHVARGVVIALVGFFVTRAAWQADASDAKGFDRALRDVADGSVGQWFVLGSAVGLVVYGVYCVLSARHQVLRRS